MRHAGRQPLSGGLGDGAREVDQHGPELHQQRTSPDHEQIGLRLGFDANDRLEYYVFRGKGDALVVVSPGRHEEPSVLDELSEFGNVAALVASNSFHWLGQALWRKHFPEARSYAPADGESDADMARRHAEVALEVLGGEGFAQPNPRPMFANPPGLLRVEPYSPGLRDRIWWGSSSNATSIWAAQLGLNLQSSTLKDDETGEPLHVQQRKQIEAYREAWKEAGHEREPRVSVSRSIFALTTDTDRAYFGGGRDSQDQIGMIDENTRAIFGRSYAAEPDVLVEELRTDEAIQAADTLLLTVPNQLGVEYNAHVIENILVHVAPALGWR